MWRMISRLVPATLATSLAFAGLATTQARSATIQDGTSSVQAYDYSTYGSIANQAGVAPIYFNSASTPTLTTPGTFSLGQFDTASTLPTTATLTYNNTPFVIDLNVASGNGTGTYTYMISGNLNGSITGAGFSNMVATVSSITGVSSDFNGTMSTPPFPVSDLTVDVPQGITAPNSTTYGDGYTTLYAQVSLGGPGLPTPAPEPASIAIFAVGLVGWGLRRRMTRSKSQPTV